MISTVELDACVEIFRKHAKSSGHSTRLNKAAFATLLPTDNVSISYFLNMIVKFIRGGITIYDQLQTYFRNFSSMEPLGCVTRTLMDG